MRVYRIAQRQYALDRTGEGARLAGGRWNRKGVAAIYCAEHPALAMLEIVVHKGLDMDVGPLGHVLVAADLPDDSIVRIAHMPGEPEHIGTEWLRDGSSLALDVPSVIVPHSRNIIMNPAHPRFDEVELHQLSAVPFDHRLGLTI